MRDRLRIVLFGTFDVRRHPRVRVLGEGLERLGHSVDVVNVPLDLDTAARVRLAAQPWRAPAVAVRLVVAWIRLLARSRGVERPDAVVVGYLGQFDVHLARLRWPHACIAVDHMVSLADTVRDRDLERPLVARALRLADRASTRTADIVIVDTADNARQLPESHRHKAVIVPVGAPQAWFDASGADSSEDRGPTPLRVVFFGLYTPLQGAPTIGGAIGKLEGRAISWTMIGSGQDRAITQSTAAGANVTWVDWVEADELPKIVANHDVCLGIFGSGPKARRVVPNKVFQGAAVGCAIITSDTRVQRGVLGDAAIYIPPGDAGALAEAVAGLADDPAALAARRRAAAELARRAFTPAAVSSSLADALTSAHHERMPDSLALPPLAPNAALRWHVVQQRLDQLQPRTVLELGAGQGSVGTRIAQHAGYVGVEPDLESQSTARARLPASARLLAGIGELEEGETFDLACAFEVLEHIADDRVALAQCVAHVRPGGHVLVSVPADPNRFGPADELAGHMRRYSSEDLAALLESAGLEVLSIERYGFPLGVALETGRNAIAARRLARESSSADPATRTAGSGRHLQPPAWAGRAIWLATAPFRMVQTRFPDRGRGFLGLARRPA